MLASCGPVDRRSRPMATSRGPIRAQWSGFPPSPLPSEAEQDAGTRRSIAISQQLGITWVKSYYSAKDGKWYCEFEAPNADLIWEHARLGQYPIDRVYPIDLVVDPGMFR